MKHIDMETIDGCETAFNHTAGRIKKSLDGIGNKERRLRSWNFLVQVMLFMEKIVTMGDKRIVIIKAQFVEFVSFITEICQEVGNDE